MTVVVNREAEILIAALQPHRQLCGEATELEGTKSTNLN